MRTMNGPALALAGAMICTMDPSTVPNVVLRISWRLTISAIERRKMSASTRKLRRSGFAMLYSDRSCVS